MRIIKAAIAACLLALATATLATPASAAADTTRTLPSYGTRVDTSVDPDGFLLDKSKLNAATLPPSCVTADTDEDAWWLYVIVLNGCDQSYRIKIVIAFGPDSACKQMAPHSTWRWRYAVGRFDGLVRC